MIYSFKNYYIKYYQRIYEYYCDDCGSQSSCRCGYSSSNLSVDAIDCVIYASKSYDDISKLFLREELIDKLVFKYRKRHVMRINNNESSETSDGFYVDILSNLERIGDHCNNIVINITQENYYHEDLDNEY